MTKVTLKKLDLKLSGTAKAIPFFGKVIQASLRVLHKVLQRAVQRQGAAGLIQMRNEFWKKKLFFNIEKLIFVPFTILMGVNEMTFCSNFNGLGARSF